MQKKCFKCHMVKPLCDYYRHKKMGDGHLNKCKECTKIDVHLDRLTSPNARAYDVKRYRENSERKKHTRKIAREWANNHPLERRAQSAVAYAIRTGKMRRRPCVVCGKAKHIHAHHEDCTKFLDVIWLCALHHRQHHEKIINALEHVK